MTAGLTVTEIRVVIPERNRVRVRTECSNQDGVVVVTGESEVAPRREEAVR